MAIVGKGDILEFDAPLQTARIYRVGVIADSGNRIPHLKEFAQTRGLGHNAVNKTHRAFQANDDEAGEIHEGDHFADGRLSANVEQRADDNDGEHRQGRRRARQHRGQGPPG